MQTSVQPLTPRDALPVPTLLRPGCRRQRPFRAAYTSLFPPKDADAEARRRWLASPPAPEVVFAAAV